MTETDLNAGLAESRAETDRLFQLISDEDLYARPVPLRNRLIFYVGHLEAFDWAQLADRSLGAGSLDPSLDRLFERGIDPDPGQLPSDLPRDWPGIDHVKDYVRSVRERLETLWPEAPAHVRQMALEHRWMHAETLAYMLHNLPHEKKRKPALLAEPEERAGIVDQRLIAIPKGTATLGRRSGDGFGWDNEFEELAVEVPAFSISKYKITNGEYLAYVQEGHEAPFFWSCLNGEWYRREMFDFVPLPLDAPVYVTQQQAAAFAKWRGMDLPTEPQFHRAAYGTPEGNEREFPWGADATHPDVNGNFDFQHWDPVSVLSHPGGRSAFGVAQLVGNGWEWTSTPFRPLPGFTPMPTYPGYSADFFDNKHYVIKGASPRTAAILTRRSVRNWFRPDYPYLYAAFRLVEN